MRTLFLLSLLAIAAAPALAVTPTNHAPAKIPAIVVPNVVNPDRQGGDTIADAVPITSLPFNTTGTTTGYVDDYDESCPYTSSSSPDVVYTFNAPGDWEVNVDLCGSEYDTKTYIYDANFNLIACNDDYYSDAICGYYTSRIDGALVSGLIYIVIDGYYGAHGDYTLAVTGGPYVPCTVTCPEWATHEGEPPLHDGYVDHYNGGCNTFGFPFQHIMSDGSGYGDATVCGVSGWYLHNGASYRDTDWYLMTIGPGGQIEVTADAVQESYIFELGPHDCATVGVLQLATIGPCEPGQMTIPGPYGSLVWFWVGPTVFETPPGDENMYDYILWITGMELVDAAESTTWSTVKALFR